MKVLNIICILLSFCNGYKINNKISRRNILSSSLASSLLIPNICNSYDDQYIENSKRLLNLSPSFNNFENDKSDPYSYWSFFGLAPPHIEKVITYDELIKKINNNEIYTIQQAYWHDCIIATTNNGHRISCKISDKNIDKLFIDVNNKHMPVNILPIDPIRSNIRTISEIIFFPLLITYILSELDIIPYQFEAYNSLKEKEEFYYQNKKPEKLIYRIKRIYNNITNII